MIDLTICERCGLPKLRSEPDDDICVGHVSMADIYVAMYRQQGGAK